METLIALLEFYNTYDHSDIFFDVAQYLLNNIEDLNTNSLQELADKIPVSVSTMNRFIKAMMFNNYSTIRKLQKSIDVVYETEGKYFPNHFTSKEKSFLDYGDMMATKIREVTSSIKKEFIMNMVEDMLKCDEIIFVGSPIPYGVWRLQVDLVLMKKKVSAFLDPNYQIEQIKQATPNSMVILLRSITPSDNFFMELIKEAKDNGMKTALIANVISSSSIEYIDYPLVFNGTQTEIDSHLIHVILSLIGIVINEKLEIKQKELLNCKMKSVIEKSNR